MSKIEINSTNGYLNLEDLPQNCIFNKKITGCGGTTIALKNDKNYVIAVPTVELIVNKIKRDIAGVGITKFSDGTSKEVFGIFGMFTYTVKKELKNYLKKDETKKIICTYDKLPKLKDYLNPKDYELLVDEYQNLLKAYSYRDKAIDGVLNSYKEYKSACFMSATPIKPDFTPDALKDLEYIEAEWNNTDKLIVSLQQTNKPFICAANIIRKYKKDGYLDCGGIKSYEAFFFINSVTDIISIILAAQLAPEDVRIICSDNANNRRTLDDKLGTGFKIENSNCPNKMFTFLTCKSFEGVDYESETGICFVVSSSSNVHTQAAIDTDIPQIAGRIRTKDNPFRDKIIHIFNTTYKDLKINVTYEEMKKDIDRELELGKYLCSFYDSQDNEMKEYISKVTNCKYIYCKDGKYYVNDVLPKLELYNWQINQVIYKSGLSIKKTYDDNNILRCDNKYDRIDEDIKIEKINRPSFKELYLQAIQNIKDKNYFANEYIYKLEPLVKKAIEELTEKEVRSSRYLKKNIKELLITKNDRLTANNKVCKLLKSKVGLNKFISRANLKSMLANLYRECGITDTAKATDITKYYEAKEVSKKIDGKVVGGFILLRENLLFI